MQPFSGNQRPDLLTSLMNMSLALRLPCDMHLSTSSSNVPRLPSSWKILQYPHVFLAHFWQGAESLAPATRNHIWTFKSGPSMWCFYIWTWKCASRHNGVHFFDIATSKSAPNVTCFLHFDFEMCFAAQRRALFHHLNFQKRSESIFSLLTSKCASRHNGVQIVISHLPRRLRTRRFSEPTFRPSREPQIIGKTQCFATFLPFRTYIFFPLTLSLLWSSFSSLLWLFPPTLFHLSILSEVRLLNFLRQAWTADFLTEPFRAYTSKNCATWAIGVFFNRGILTPFHLKKKPVKHTFSHTFFCRILTNCMAAYLQVIFS